jgi:hypothetical protein
MVAWGQQLHPKAGAAELRQPTGSFVAMGRVVYTSADITAGANAQGAEDPSQLVAESGAEPGARAEDDPSQLAAKTAVEASRRTIQQLYITEHLQAVIDGREKLRVRPLNPIGAVMEYGADLCRGTEAWIDERDGYWHLRHISTGQEFLLLEAIDCTKSKPGPKSKPVVDRLEKKIRGLIRRRVLPEDIDDLRIARGTLDLRRVRDALGVPTDDPSDESLRDAIKAAYARPQN